MPFMIHVLLFVCLSALCLITTPISSFASDDVDAPKPYKATTVDECIQEQECVWYPLRRVLCLKKECSPPYRSDKRRLELKAARPVRP